LSLYHLKPENMQAYVDLLESRQFKYYAGYPSGVYLVADFLRSIGHTLGNPPEIIVTGAESLLPFQRKAFTEWIGAPSTDQYGQAEGVANLSRCEDDLYHEDMEFCVIEREKVTETPEGDVCRILGTALHNYAQPFIRYDTGDLASFNNRKCSCGRQTPVASCVDGRIESYVVTPDGRRVGRMDHCFKDLTSIREAQIVQHVPNELEVLLVPAPEFDGEVERELIDEIHSRVGGEMKVVVNITDAIPRTRTGKFRAVISKLDNELESHIQQ
ncbi:MAG TPA: hypothetical protein QF564_01410, partial [Pirellulaceae bacterium]|nr:hypothetical protein [Pirellulaceae bacterium]